MLLQIRAARFGRARARVRGGVIWDVDPGYWAENGEKNSGGIWKVGTVLCGMARGEGLGFGVGGKEWFCWGFLGFWEMRRRVFLGRQGGMERRGVWGWVASCARMCTSRGLGGDVVGSLGRGGEMEVGRVAAVWFGGGLAGLAAVPVTVVLALCGGQRMVRGC